MAFASVLETIQETANNKPDKHDKHDNLYTLLQTIALDLKISINKQDLIIEMLKKK